MKVKINSDRWYPVYSFSNHGKEVEVSKDFKEVYDNVMKDFNTVQDILREIYEN